MKRAKNHLDVQWPEDPSDCFSQTTDIRQGQAGPWYPLVILSSPGCPVV